MKYYIVFYDKSVREITDKQNDEILGAFMANEEKIQIGNSLITLKSIQKVLDEKDFYQEYPDQKPIVYEDKFKKYESIEHRAGSSQRMLKLFIKGVQQHIDEQGGFDRASQGSKDLLHKFQTKLKQYEAK